MENKYYQPDISEFHIGFEYEVFDWGGWKKQTYNQNSFLQVYQDGEYEFESIEPNYIRVKYLDREDIESLGFEYYDYIPQGDGDYRWWDGYTKNEYHIAHSNQWAIYNVTIRKNNSTLFEGKIKNKSELIKLLKQLSINE